MRLAKNKKFYIDYAYTGEQKEEVEIIVTTKYGSAVIKVRPVGKNSVVDLTMSTFDGDANPTGLHISQMFRPHMKSAVVPPYKDKLPIKV